MLAALIGAAATAATAADGARGADAVDARARLEALHYDLEVASYCGLVDGAVSAGFRTAAGALIAASGLDRDGLDALRGRAWQAAHAEWQNRGLGGFRNWCRTDAVAGAARLAGPDWQPPAR